VGRKEDLWADRFKNTIPENGLAVWDCWKHIEMNPVRAHMVKKPGRLPFLLFRALERHRQASLCLGRHPPAATHVQGLAPGDSVTASQSAPASPHVA